MFPTQFKSRQKAVNSYPLISLTLLLSLPSVTITHMCAYCTLHWYSQGITRGPIYNPTVHYTQKYITLGLVYGKVKWASHLSSLQYTVHLANLGKFSHLPLVPYQTCSNPITDVLAACLCYLKLHIDNFAAYYLRPYIVCLITIQSLVL